jgi:hypothetical protein
MFEILTVDNDCEVIWFVNERSWVWILMKMNKITICIDFFDVFKSNSLQTMSFIVKYCDWINSFIFFTWSRRLIFFNSFESCFAWLSRRKFELKIRFEIMIVFADDNEDLFKMISENNIIDFWKLDFWVIFLLCLRFLSSCTRSSFRNRFFLNLRFFSDDLIMIASYAIWIWMWRKSNENYQCEKCKKNEMMIKKDEK